MRSTLGVAVVLAMGLGGGARAALLDGNWTQKLDWAVNTPGGGSHTGFGWAPDGSDRLFVIQKGGQVRVLSGALSTGAGTWSTFATESVYTASECGLIGMAFDPNFARNHYLYLFVTVSDSEQRIVRYDASGAVGTGRTVIVDGLPTDGQNHDGGALGFGHDGKLYWAIGDQGNRTGVDGDLASLAAKVGRAERDGAPVADNPFADAEGPNDEYIWARGFRNPFTMTFQPATGALWLNVVGDGYEQIFRVARGDHGGYDNYENNQPTGFLAPRIAYRTNGVDVRNITQTARSGGIATFTTSQAHRLHTGEQLSIAGVADASFNQAPAYVASVPTATSFTIVQPGPDVAAATSGGTLTTLEQGGSLTGGVFYDATLAPPEYRGNLFYGDFNSGRIMRAQFDAAGEEVRQIDHWADGLSTQLDIAVGPDGALYYLSYTGTQIRRAHYDVTAQGIVVANQHLRIDERGAVVATVRLAMEPAADVVVNVARSTGDGDVVIEGPSTLTFTPTDWMRPQAVVIAAEGDPDTADDAATVELSSDGLDAVAVEVSVLDLGALPGPPVFADGFEDE